MVYIETPGKINLHLEIKDLRPDGYHDLVSIFQSVSIYDRLVVRSLKIENECKIKGDFDFPERENIVYKACEEFRAVTGISRGIEVVIEKRIPMGAGLGGGSSDAAATIKCLETLFDRKLSKSESDECASKLGSDVYFFLNGAAGLVTGRGDTVTPLQPRTDYEIVIVNPGFGISTKLAYVLLDEKRKSAGKVVPLAGIDEVERSYRECPVSDWRFDNSFSEVLVRHYPLLEEIIEKLKKSGACYSNITGSGSCVFGIFRKNGMTPAILQEFEQSYKSVFYVKPLDKNPLTVLQ
jgi:4-diphosphocytidyl-2-C-methyl-D-erythritol kinase